MLFILVNQLWFKNICQCKIFKILFWVNKVLQIVYSTFILDVKLAYSFPTKGSLSLIYTSRILGKVTYKAISFNRWKFFWGCTNLVHTISKKTAKSINVTIMTILSNFLLIATAVVYSHTARLQSLHQGSHHLQKQDGHHSSASQTGLSWTLLE